MKIIILGAGQVGASVAEALISEANDITVIDTDAESLSELHERLEVRTVCGNAASPSVLREAGADNSDLLIAVTQSDQINLCACKTARTLFNLPMRIARLRSADYIEYPELLADDNFAVDFAICPEQIVTDYIRRLIDFPDALQVLDFSNGKGNLISVIAREGQPLVGRPLADVPASLPDVQTHIASIYRHGNPISPSGDTIILPNDEVFCLAAPHHTRDVMAGLCGPSQPMQRIVIAGGGNIGRRLAVALEGKYNVKLLEENGERAEVLANELHATLVLHANSTDEKVLENEGIDETDLFVALTNDEEDNIMSAILAKRMGARQTLALINRKSYVSLVEGGPIDIVISPAQASIGVLLAHVRRGDVVGVHSLRRGSAEALEIVAHGQPGNSKVVGHTISELNLPDGVTINAIVRQDTNPDDEPVVLIPRPDTVIENEDHVIVFCPHKNLVKKVEKLFQVGFTFL